MPFILIIFLLLIFDPTSVNAEPRHTKGHIQNDRGEDCWYRQQKQEGLSYFYKNLTGPSWAMTFDNPRCMSETDDLGLGINIMMINNVISRWYSHPDAKFLTRKKELRSGSPLQIKGKCIQSRKYPIVGITVDYVIEGGFITRVIHGSSVTGCNEK